MRAFSRNKNNRECVHNWTMNARFHDLTDTADFLMIIDPRNPSHINTGDLIKFNRLNTETGRTERVYGLVAEFVNIHHTAFMICRHYDKTGKPFYLDYVYKPYNHAFKRLNRHGSFSDWDQLTHINGVHAPSDFVEYWMTQHATTECTTERPEYKYDAETEHINQEQIPAATANDKTVMQTVAPGYDTGPLHLRDDQYDNYVYWR